MLLQAGVRDLCAYVYVQVKEKLTPYGPLKAFNLVMDKQTGNSKVCLTCRHYCLSVLYLVAWCLYALVLCYVGRGEGD